MVWYLGRDRFEESTRLTRLFKTAENGVYDMEPGDLGILLSSVFIFIVNSLLSLPLHFVSK